MRSRLCPQTSPSRLQNTIISVAHIRIQLEGPLFMEVLAQRYRWLRGTDGSEVQMAQRYSWLRGTAGSEVQLAQRYRWLIDLSRSEAQEQKRSHDNKKKVDVIDLTLDSSSEEEEEPPMKRPCPSLSPVSPPGNNNIINKGVLNLHQSPPVTRAPSRPPVETSYIPPPPPLIQDYRHYYHAANDLPELNFFSFLQGDNQHYNMVMAAAASASSSEEQELLLSRFLPYTSAQMLREAGSGSSSVGVANGNSSSGSSSSLVSSSSLRERDKEVSGLSRSSVEAAAAVAAIYGSIIWLEHPQCETLELSARLWSSVRDSGAQCETLELSARLWSSVRDSGAQCETLELVDPEGAVAALCMCRLHL
uniref:Uncharacterized protein n=1 Tax=Knipowitschia caucasica TaxID=637954 RepID=A0AAV2L1K6_KNICA